MISAILLAAGQSKRMKGENKLTKKIRGIPLINYSVKNILNSNIDELIIVLGYQNTILRKIIKKNIKIKFIYNKNYKSGMASSIKIGLKNLSKKTDFFFICLGDMPLINKDIYNQLIKHRNINDIIVPTYKSKQGNPVLFSQVMKKKINNILGDLGAKKILKSNKNKIFFLKFTNKKILKDYNTVDNFNS